MYIQKVGNSGDVRKIVNISLTSLNAPIDHLDPLLNVLLRRCFKIDQMLCGLLILILHNNTDWILRGFYFNWCCIEVYRAGYSVIFPFNYYYSIVYADLFWLFRITITNTERPEPFFLFFSVEKTLFLKSN